MKWFRKWMLDSLRRASAEEQSRAEDIADYDHDVPPSTYAGLSKGLIPAKKRRGGLNTITSAMSDMDLPEGGLNIQVKSAIGGKIVIFRSYDDRTDRNCYSTYLIPDTERFEESLGKIITMESLKL
jgi:hypothetical protein